MRLSSPRRHFIEQATRFAVLGMGVSGIAAANALAALGKQVTISDTRQEDKLIEAIAQLAPQVSVHTGQNYTEGAQVVVVSPGLKPSLPLFEQLRQAQIPFISEVELAYELAVAPFVSITGTDGKTTTTTLVGACFERAGRPLTVAGNIGTPLCEVVQQIPEDGVIVAEISAFQLWTTHNFRSAAAAVTNIADDHLDHYDGDFERYAQSKLRLLANADERSWAVLNAHDARIMQAVADYPGQVILFGYGQDPAPSHPHVLWSDGESFYGRLRGQELGVWCAGVKGLPLQGRHNHLNMLCAAGLAMSQGVSAAHIVEAFESFKPLPHRMEPCGQLGAVRFWDDSKATNAHAALAGLNGLDGAVIPIVGGVDKQLSLSALIQFIQASAPACVLIGQLAARLRQELIEAGYNAANIQEVASMEEAVARAIALARTHQALHISLSPACSSFDMYKSYAHRGEVFQACVKETLAKA